MPTRPFRTNPARRRKIHPLSPTAAAAPAPPRRTGDHHAGPAVLAASRAFALHQPRQQGRRHVGPHAPSPPQSVKPQAAHASLPPPRTTRTRPKSQPAHHRRRLAAAARSPEHRRAPPPRAPACGNAARIPPTGSPLLGATVAVCQRADFKSPSPSLSSSTGLPEVNLTGLPGLRRRRRSPSPS
jgi:hypothetical protein